MGFFVLLFPSLLGTLLQALWFSPLMFGKKLPPVTFKHKIFSLFITFILLFILTWIFAFLEVELRVTSWSDGLVMGAIVWLGFILIFDIFSLAWKKISFHTFLITTSYKAVTLILIGAILAG